MRRIAKLFGIVAKTVKWCFIVFCVFLASLFFRQQELPEFLVRGLCERFSAGDTVLSCDSASFGFREGFNLRDVRLYDRSRRDAMSPVCSVESVSIWPLRRRVRIVAAKFPRLGDEYYGYVTNECEEAVAEAASFEPPRIPAFDLELVDPEILGVAPERVTARVEVSPRKIEIRGFHLDWPDQEVRMELDGRAVFDLAAEKIRGEVHGSARQEHIRPLLKALDIPQAYPYMGGYPDTGTNGFTEVIGPVPASCSFTVDLAARDLELELDLHPTMGKYNGVRMQRADGKLGVHNCFSPTNRCYDVRIGPLVATDLKGRALSGEMAIRGTNDCDWLEFNAASAIAKDDLLGIMDCFAPGTFDGFVCLKPPRITAKGIFNIDDVNIPNNDFSGTMELDDGILFEQHLRDVRCDYRLRASEVEFTNLTAVTESGGEVAGSMRFHVPIADDDEEFYGEGRVDVRNGRIIRLPLFLALTTALADNVPGVDKLVDQSEAWCDFTVSNGVFRTGNMVVQGALVCIRVSGSCDMESGELDMFASCTVMKEESVLGKYLIRPVLWPFTKLLTEFHVTGTKDAPKLTNTSVKKISETFKKVFD